MGKRTKRSDVLEQGYAPNVADVWSCGVILFTLLVGNTPWDEPTTRSYEFSEYVNSGGKMGDDLWEKLPAKQKEVCRLRLAVARSPIIPSSTDTRRVPRPRQSKEQQTVLSAPERRCRSVCSSLLPLPIPTHSLLCRSLFSTCKTRTSPSCCLPTVICASAGFAMIFVHFFVISSSTLNLWPAGWPEIMYLFVWYCSFVVHGIIWKCSTRCSYQRKQ